MRDKFVLTYRAEAPRTKRRLVLLLVAVLGLPVLIYLLFELQRLPYRPPLDMSTMLGAEIFLVWLFMGVLAITWIACAAALGWVIRRRNSSI